MNTLTPERNLCPAGPLEGLADRWKLNLSGPNDPQGHVRIAQALAGAGCVRFGDFILKSGAPSPFYLDLRRIGSFPSLFEQITATLSTEASRMVKEGVHLAGVPQAGIPFATAVALSLHQSLIFPRQAAKDYGTLARVDGVYQKGDAVVLIDDVISTGKSKREILSVLRAEKLALEGILVIIDRRTRSQKEASSLPCAVRSIFQMKDLLDIWLQNSQIDEASYVRSKSFLED